MRKYTEAEPFEFEGGALWRNRQGGIAYHMPHDAEYRFKPGENTWLAQAHHAFIEAERDEWHYTNEAETGARKGRFTAKMTDSRGWRFAHDELPGLTAYRSAPDSVARGFDVVAIGFDEAFKGVIDDFEAWHAAQQPPEEPTGFGYVGYVDGPEHGRLDVTKGAGTRDDLYHATRRADGCHYGQMTWESLLKLGIFTGVES